MQISAWLLCLYKKETSTLETQTERVVMYDNFVPVMAEDPIVYESFGIVLRESDLFENFL